MNDAIDALLAARAMTHGRSDIHAHFSQLLKDIMRSENGNWDSLVMRQKESLEMIAHKIARILAGDSNHKDHWDDIAGYARLVADSIKK